MSAIKWAIGIAIALLVFMGWQIWTKMGSPFPNITHGIPWWAAWVALTVLLFLFVKMVRSVLPKKKDEEEDGETASRKSGGITKLAKTSISTALAPAKWVLGLFSAKEEKKGKPIIGHFGTFILILVVFGMLLPLCGEAYRNYQRGKTTQEAPVTTRWWFQKVSAPTAGRPDGSLKQAKLVTIERWDQEVMHFRVSWWTTAGSEKATDFILDNPGEPETNSAPATSTDYRWDKFTSPRHGTWTIRKKGSGQPLATGKWFMAWSESGGHYLGQEQDTDGVWHAFVLRPEKGR